MSVPPMTSFTEASTVRLPLMTSNPVLDTVTFTLRVPSPSVMSKVSGLNEAGDADIDEMPTSSLSSWMIVTASSDPQPPRPCRLLLILSGKQPLVSSHHAPLLNWNR